MMKVESMSEEEKIQNKKFKTLVEIAKEIFGEEQIFGGALMLLIRKPNEVGIDESIIANTNTIRVYSQNNFDTATKLAEEYKQRVGEEITVRKEYED